MSDEDAFLSGIAADRADRTQLLVFADWLGDRGDPREEFVRLHARLLDMRGTEPEFEGAEQKWLSWVGCVPQLTGRNRLPRLDDKWLDALCRVCTHSDVQEYAKGWYEPGPMRAEMREYGHADHTGDGEEALILYSGSRSDYIDPIGFVAETILTAIWENPFFTYGTHALANCPPMTRGRFWKHWTELCSSLRDPPQVPQIDDDVFLAAQFISSTWDNWGMVATYESRVFGLFWSTTA